MKIGRCAGLENIHAAQQAGFDYIELYRGRRRSGCRNERPGICLRIGAVSFGEHRAGGVLRDVRRRYLSPGLTPVLPRRTNMLPLCTGGLRSLADASRCSAADARRTPDGSWRSAVAENRLIIALEPLNRAETNLINNSASGAALVEAVAHPSFRLLPDYYHMALENDASGNAAKYSRPLAHARIAAPRRRRL